MSEKCDRCGCVGEDRRTLWMACFYAMNELNIPFNQASIHGVVCKKTGEKKLECFDINTPVFEEPQGEASHYGFYILRVCKRCRAEWMGAIEQWFNKNPNGIDRDSDDPQDEGINSGIFVRENGMTKEISREEWDRRNPGREPVRVIKENE